ncbi:MAG: ComEC/Rec2 family competence protein [Candidatus Staskawiczbacteria bacterium]|nr:ComEC/Rec2 family competence protein [Candidatus Staskawiczbacteria bacterium]
MSPSKILSFLCISLIIGIFLESIIKIPQIFVCGFLLLAVLAIFFAVIARHEVTKQSREYRLPRRLRTPRNDELTIAGFCILFLVIGILLVQISEFNIANDKLSKLNGRGQVVLTGVINDEPDVRDTSQMLNVKVSDSTVLVTTKRYPEFKYLDKIKLTGKLETPMVAENFNYKNYLLKDHIYSVMAFPKIEVVSEKIQYNIYSYFYEKILFCKQKIRDSIQHNFSPPQSSILEGTILGDNGAMTSDLKSKLNITRLRHVISVSGTHIVILSSIIMSLLLAAGLWRGQAFYIAIIFICLFIILTGLPSSGIRAGIMGGLFLLAQKLGRQSNGSRVIIMACAVMLLINPLLLIYDVGFQLSFLAVMGLIYLEPFIKFLIKKFTKDKAEELVSVISTTFAAQIFTLPIMIYNFGNISFVSPITNLLISPIVYLLMVFGFLASIAGIFSNVLGFILSVPCYFLLSYFIWIINFFSKPWAMKTIQNIHWVWLIILYLIITVGTYILRKRYSWNFL